eukprot:gene39671-49020_t
MAPVDNKKPVRWGDEDEETEGPTPAETNGVKVIEKVGVNSKGQKHPDDQLNEDLDDPSLAKTLQNFITNRAERSFARDNGAEDGDDFNRDTVTVGGAGGEAPVKSDRYVAPTGRGGGATTAAFSKDGLDGTENTLRVSNLTKAATEDDLRELFERFGRIHRISLPRIELANGTKEVRGFAYIAFANHDDAEEAMNRLQNYGYDHLIMKIEWAKPTKDGAGGGGGG